MPTKNPKRKAKGLRKPKRKPRATRRPKKKTKKPNRPKEARRKPKRTRRPKRKPKTYKKFQLSFYSSPHWDATERGRWAYILIGATLLNGMLLSEVGGLV